jgi:hypothetical protein
MCLPIYFYIVCKPRIDFVFLNFLKVNKRLYFQYMKFKFQYPYLSHWQLCFNIWILETHWDNNTTRSINIHKLFFEKWTRKEALSHPLSEASILNPDNDFTRKEIIYQHFQWTSMHKYTEKYQQTKYSKGLSWLTLINPSSTRLVQYKSTSNAKHYVYNNG